MISFLKGFFLLVKYHLFKSLACLDYEPEEIYFHGDGICDDFLNKDICAFDGGDCCDPDAELYHCTLCECFQY